MSISAHFKSLWFKLTEFFTESRILSLLLVVLALIFGFFQIADEVMDNDKLHLDERILLMFRDPADLHETIGPEWLKSFFMDVTALGGTTNLILITLITLGFLWVIRKRRLFLLVLLSVVGGQIFNSALKSLFLRSRPDVVPHLTEVQTPSFPSGHSMMSAVVYLTLGMLLSRLVAQSKHRFYIISTAIILTVLIGISRIFLGVHYPTDVLAGWTAGLTWALICLLIARILQHRGTVEQPEYSVADN